MSRCPTPAPSVVRRALLEVFRQFGLPRAIRSDNGSPFASRGPAGLSELSAWWLKLGIRHERIEPGKPQQNGRLERMHLTLKLDTAMPPRGSLRAQQRAFDRFRREYNELRPHEGLAHHLPADFYSASSRALPEPYWGKDFCYPEDFEVVRVRKPGTLQWNNRAVFVTSVLRHQLLGLQTSSSIVGRPLRSRASRLPVRGYRPGRALTDLSEDIPDTRFA